MKKFYILIIALLSLHSFSQSDYSRYYNSWRLGLNIGGAWQTADYRSCWGMAGGLTLEKGLHENKTNIFSFAIRGRYLAANTYGMDYNRNYDVKTNDAYNGKYDPAVNFVDSVKPGKQYVYDNYKMTLGEGSLELQLTFNRLRERTNVLLNLWGGIGFTSYRTQSDLLDGNGKMYDFSLVDSTGNKTKALNSYNGLIDKKYESYAYGSRQGNLVTFSPSAGIGLGYQFSPGFSMLWEYKVTFPLGTNADLLDGKLSMNNDAIAGSNDYYHYTGLNLVFTLRGKHKTNTTPPKDETVYTPTTVPTATSVPTNSITPTASIVTNSPPATTVSASPPKDPKPVITFITPPSNAFIVNNQNYKITAQVLNVSASNKIQFKFNGAPHTDFTYSSQTHILEYNATLNSGNNSVQVIASNATGTDNKLTSVIYEQPKAAGNPPIVSFINPVQPGTTVSVNTYTVNAQVLNVPTQKAISVYFNGMSTLFTYNSVSKQVSFVTALKEGLNTISITALNSLGQDTKVSNITFKENKPSVAPPFVKIINPTVSPSSSSTTNYIFKASVTNITTKSQLLVKMNGNVVSNFAFSAPNVICPAILIEGNNIFEVTATNNDGTDTKNAIVNYKSKETVILPVVNLINPATVLNATDNSLCNFKLSVLNVTSKADIEVVFNGSVQQGFTYDAVTKEIFLQTSLAIGDNTLSVKGTNKFGTDFKQINVNYTPRLDLKTPPVISIINPLNSPSTSSAANYIFKANVTNVTSKSQLIVKVNGNSITSFTFNGSGVICPVVLIQGNNIFEVTASNNDGTDTKSVIVNYKPKVVANPPVVNLINPSSVLNATDNNLYNFKLSVLNVNSKADVEVLFNGVVQPGFTFDALTKEMFFQTTLSIGDNTLSVKGTNQFGSDSKQVNVRYTAPADIKLPPVVTISNPAGAAATTSKQNYTFNASITNIPGTGGLVVKYNGNVITNYTYDGMNLSYPVALSEGNNAFEVKATNNDGTDLKSVVVTYKMRELALPPTISFVNPINNSSTVQNANYVFKATLSNMPNTTGMTVNYNGVAITNYIYDGINFTYTAALKKGQNTLEISASNKDGNDVKTAIVNYVPARPPVVIIVQPSVTPTVNAASYNFVFKVFNVDQSQIEVTLNGNPVTSYTFAKPEGKFTGILMEGPNVLKVKATNADGTATKTGTVTYVILKDTASIPDPNGNTTTPGDPKTFITICHYPPGNNQNPQTLSISATAWVAHQAHGDTQGECPAKTDSLKVKINPENDSLKKPAIVPRRPR